MQFRNRIVKPLVLAVSLAGLGLTGCSGKDEPAASTEAQQILTRANAYYTQGQYRAAIIETKNALQKDNSNVAAKVLAANIYNELGNAKQAAGVLESTDYKHSPDAFVALVQAQILRAKAKTALELLDAPPSGLSAQQQLQLKLERARAHTILKQESEATPLFEELAASGDAKISTEARLSLAGLALRANDTARAVTIIDEVLAATPNNADALILKANIAYNNKELDKTEDLLSQALINMPTTDILTAKRVQVLDTMIRVLTLQGRTAEAMVYTQTLNDANPDLDNARATFDEAIALFRDGKLKEAEEKLLQLYNDNAAPDAAGRLLGLIKMKEGDLAGAEEYFEQHIDPETATPDTLRVIAENKLRMNHPGEALALIEENIGKNPESADLLAVYGLAALAQGDEKKGLDAINKAIEKAPDRGRLRLVLADYHVRKGNTAEAAQQLQLAYESSPADTQIAARYIKQLLGQQKNDQALAAASSLAEKGANADAYTVLATTHLQLKEFDKARAAYEKAIALDGKHINSLIGLAVLAASQKDFGAAEKSLYQVIDINPDELRAYKTLAAIARQQGSVDPLIAKIRDISNSRVNAWAPETVLAEFEMARGDLQAALKHSREALTRSGFKGYPKNLNSNLCARLARDAMVQKNPDEARQYLVEALQSDTGNVMLLDLLAHAEISAGKFLEAEKIAEQIRTRYPLLPVADIILVDSLNKQGKHDDAKAKLRGLWDSKPSDAVGMRIIARLKGDEAAQFANEWATKLPDSHQALVSVAMYQQGQGKADEAISNYRKALTLAPNDPRTLNNLAWMLYERSQMDEALQLSSRAASIAPNDAAVLDTHGWILFKSGKKDEALPILEKAAGLAPDSGEIQDHLKEAKG